MSVCIAFAGTVDIATNFFGLVVTVIAKGLLNAADIVLEPLLEITTMSTADVSRFVPGFDSGNNIGNFFIQAINIIAYMIAGVLICCHIISYLINIAHGEKVESIPKLIWNAVFGIVMVICGKTFLTMIFNEIVAPLSSALTEGVSDAGGTFSFSSVGSDMTGLGEITSAFDLNSLATLIVVLALMLIIWWNLIKLVLECAERYIICIFTINLSPLAFATMASENTKDTARSWLQMFWSQCVLLILNIWVVGIARTALNNGLFGASNTEMVKWGLITYAFLKIAQRLDDMMQTAGLKITRTTGLDPISEASGVLRSIGNVFGGVASVAGQVAGVGKNMWDAGKNIGKANGVEPIKSFTDFMNGGETSAQDGGYVNNASMADKMKADAVLGKETMYDRADKMASGALNADSYNTDAYKQVLEDKLRSAGHLDDDAHVESVKIGEDGKLLASAVKRDEKNRVSEKSEFEIGDTQEGLLDVNGAKKYDSMQVAPNGKSVMEEDSAMGKFGLRKVGEDAAGNQIWEAEQSVNMFGDKVKDVTPDANNKVQFTIPASEIAKGRKAGDSDAMTAYKHFNANDDNDAFKNSIRDALSAETGSAALNKARENEEEQAAMATRIGMTDKERLADMMNPDSNADYNSPNAFKAMEDHIKENAQYYPAQAAMLADGGHVTGMHVSDGTDGNPAGSLIVAIGNDQDGKNSQATCTFTRDEEPVPETAETPAAQTNEQPVKDADAAPAPVNEDAPAPVGEEASAPAPQSADEAPTAPATETAQAPVPQDVDSKVDAPAPVGEEASAPAPQSVDETATTPVAETAQTPVPQDIDSEVDAPAPVGEEAATPAPQDVGGKADAPVPASENASAPATQSADGKVAEPTSAGGATPASGVTAPAPAPAQNSTTNTVNAPVQGAAPVSGGTVPGTANAPKTANVPGMAANNMPASTAPETAATPAVNAPAPASTTGANAPTSVPGTTPAPSTASGQSSTVPGSGTAPAMVRPAAGAGSVSAPAPSASIPTAPVSGGSAGVAVAAGVAANAAGQFPTPECESFFRCHSLQLCDHIETTGLRIFLTVFAQHLIVDNNLVALADFAAFQQAVLLADRNFTVHGFRLYGVTVSGDAQNALGTGFTYLIRIQLAVTGNADDVNVFPLDAVFCQQLVEAIGITRLQENQCLALQLRQFDQILRQIAAAEIVIYKILFQSFCRIEHSRCGIIDKLTVFPAQHTNNCTVCQQLGGSFHHFALQLRSSSLLFSPSAVTVSTNSFMVAANFAPSAADTHSTRVRPFSTPMKSSMEKRSVIRLLA